MSVSSRINKHRQVEIDQRGVRSEGRDDGGGMPLLYTPMLATEDLDER